MKTRVMLILIAGFLFGIPAAAEGPNRNTAEQLGRPSNGEAVSYEQLSSMARRIKRQLETEPCFDGSLKERFNSALARARQLMRNGDTARAVEQLRRQVNKFKTTFQQLKKFDSKIRRIEKLLDEIMPLMQNYRETGGPRVENSLQKLNQLYEEALKNRRECKAHLAFRNLQYIESLIKKHKAQLTASDRLEKKLSFILQRNKSKLKSLRGSDLNSKEKSTLVQAQRLQQKAARSYAEKDFKTALRLASRVRDLLFSLGRAKLNPEEQRELKARVRRMGNSLRRELTDIERGRQNQPGGQVDSAPYPAHIETFLINSQNYSQKGNYSAAYRELKNAKATLQHVEQNQKRKARSGVLLERLAQRLERVAKLVKKSDVREAGQLVASARSHYGKALALQKSGKLKQSGTEARAVIKLMGKALHLIKGKSTGFREELESQLDDLKAQLERTHRICRDRENARCSNGVKRAFGHYTRARAYFKSHRPKQAIRHYEQSLNILESIELKSPGAESE
jgi:hypothetical protein